MLMCFSGYDEGGFSASVGLTSFKNDFNLNAKNWKDDPAGLASRKANISSFGVLGAAFGSILSLALIDRLGRLKCWRLFVLTWACGLLMQVFSSGIYGFILFARIFSGLGAGGLTVVAPLFLSEIAPAKSRGMVVSIYMVILLSVLTLGMHVETRWWDSLTGAKAFSSTMQRTPAWRQLGNSIALFKLSH